MHLKTFTYLFLNVKLSSLTENSCQQYMNTMKKLFGKLLKVLFLILNKQLIVYL